jgi:hypothetical protein
LLTKMFAASSNMQWSTAVTASNAHAQSGLSVLVPTLPSERFRVF